MKKLILTLGFISLGLGLVPEPTFEPIKKKLRIYQVEHYKCDSNGCVLTHGEM